MWVFGRSFVMSLCCNLWMENTEGIKGREQSITRVTIIIIITIKAPVGLRVPATLAFKCPLDPAHMAVSSEPTSSPLLRNMCLYCVSLWKGWNINKNEI